ncbi:sensor histidine kinase [Paenibacillus oceani]|uniref:histidine kinase n=1 Tax=Paenibacillus oceani TaxID=2772510 RepID=A0A927GZ35_9BACL|nr:HAMP domain-containing sensor histidine kinase [Paenibacillus oceani]MBD2861064.1 HAMP domain-containing histidine kinase [Paenibacillus oceani]
MSGSGKETGAGTLPVVRHSRQVRSKLIWHFVLRLVAAGMIAILLLFGVWLAVADRMMQEDLKGNFAEAGLPLLVDSVQLRDGREEYDPKLLEAVRRSGGWLQTLDERGTVTSSFYTPDDVPLHYDPGELTDYWMKNKPFRYSLYVWIEKKEGRTYTLLYGVKRTGERLLERLHTEAVYEEGRLKLAEPLLQELVRYRASVQLVNGEGGELASLNKREGIPDRYTVEELVLRSGYPNRYGLETASRYDEASGRTWIVTVPLGLPGDGDSGQSPAGDQTPHTTILLGGVFVFVTAVLVLLLALSIWYGRRFGTPMLHMMDWLHTLSQGVYREPEGRPGIPRSRKKSGKLRRKYRLYEDVLQSLDRLTHTLKDNETVKRKLEQTREEWIAGVSHDLKTPLSSIVGYAHMLETDAYEWTNEEVREFASTMKDKAAYMDRLINDLSLTYRLKSGALPMERELCDVSELVRRSVLLFVDDPRFAGTPVTFSGPDEPVLYHVDPKWFRRIVDNVLANALLHNPPDTEVRLSVCPLEPDGFTLDIEDRGRGMNKDTVDWLFERYYRGTNTEGAGNGTGLGMAIAKQLVLEHGGTIQVTSEVGRGTRVILTFGRQGRISGKGAREIEE